MAKKYFSLSSKFSKKFPKSFSPKKKPSSFLKALRNYGFSMEKAPSFSEQFPQTSSLGFGLQGENPLCPLAFSPFPKKPPSYLYVATPLVFGGFRRPPLLPQSLQFPQDPQFSQDPQRSQTPQSLQFFQAPQSPQLQEEPQTSPLEEILQKKLFFTQLSFGEPYIFHWSSQRESLEKLFPRDYSAFLLFLQKKTREQEKHQNPLETEEKRKIMTYKGFPPGWCFSFQHHVLKFFTDNDLEGQKIIALGGCYDEFHPHIVYEAYGFMDNEGYFREEAPWSALPPHLQKILPSFSLKSYGQGRYDEKDKKEHQFSSAPHESSASKGFSCTLSLGHEDQNILYESVDVQPLWTEETTQHPWCFFLLRRRI